MPVARVMRVLVAVLVGVAVIVAVRMAVLAQGDRDAIGLAGSGALVLAEGAALDQTLHVVVVTALRRTHLSLKAQHLGAVLAEGAVHLRLTADHLLHTFAEGVDHQRVIAQVARIHKLHTGVISRHQGGVLANPAHQHAGEQEIREHHNAAEAQAHHVAQARLHQREGHTGIHGLPPAEAEALHQHPRHLGHIGIGIRVRGATPHHHQQGVGQGHWRRACRRGRLIGALQGLTDAGPRRLDHLQIDAQLTAVLNAQAGLGGVSVENGGDVVLGMAGGEQHARHRQHPLHPLLPQAI